MTTRAAVLLSAGLALSTPGGAQVATSTTRAALPASAAAARPHEVRVAEPSARFQRFGHPGGLFTIDHPDNWRAYGAEDGSGVSMAPDGGVIDTGNGRPTMVYGVIVGRYTPFQDAQLWRVSLEGATDDLVGQILTSNPYLRVSDAQSRPELVAGAPSLTLALSGRSPVTGQEERVTLVTRRLPDGQALYALSVVPGGRHDSMAKTFGRMLHTLSVGGAPERVARAALKDARR